MDPLSIATGIITILTASGQTLQGLKKVWSLQHRTQEFVGLWNQASGVRALLWGTEIALRRIKEDEKKSPHIQDCLANIDRLVLEATEIYAVLDKAIRDVAPQKGGSSSKKPSKRSWLRRKSKITHLTSQISALAVSLNSALSILQGVQSSVTANQTAIKIDMVLTKVEALVTESSDINSVASLDTQIQSMVDEDEVDERVETSPTPEPPVPSNSLSRRSSWQSFHSACSSSSDSSGTLVSFSGSLSADTECENFCPCQCHVSTQSKMPWWITQLLGSMTTHGNGSMLLNRQTCNKKHCRRSGSTRVQISYVAPAWTILPAFNIYVRAETIAGLIPSFTMFMPRVIPKTAPVWSIIELGRLDEFRSMLSRREASPYDISSQGVSLLKYAAIKGQNDILACLLSEKSDPLFRDQSGMVAIQPGIDRVLSGSALDRDASGTARISYAIFTTSENLDQQNFTMLHLIVLQLRCLDLEMVLRYYPIDIDAPDANGRTPLLWASWRGDAVSVGLLLKYGADCERKDNQEWTPLAKACKAGHLDVVQCLISSQASPTTSTSQGFQPIYWASENKPNGARIVKELLDFGADPNTYSKLYGTPLHNAANRGSVDTIKCLLAHGSDIDATDSDGDTPTLIALACWNEPSFFHLAEAGAQLDIVRKSGHGVLHFATWFASPEVWQLVIRYAKVGKLRKTGTGVLHSGHSIQTCFEKCRSSKYPKTREYGKEILVFRQMIQAIEMSLVP